jgi:hypothetical protein
MAENRTAPIPVRSPRRVAHQQAGHGYLVWSARIGGIALALLALGSFVFPEREPFASLDPSAFENVIHLGLAAALLYSGFARNDAGLSRTAVLIVGVFALFAGVMGFTPVPEFMADEGVAPSAWGWPHRLFHVTIAVVCLGAWLVTRESKREPSAASS